MISAFGQQPEPFSCEGRWEFNLPGQSKKYTVRVHKLQKGILAIPEDDVEHIRDLSLASMLKIGHAPHYVEIRSLLMRVSTASCRLITS